MTLLVEESRRRDADGRPIWDLREGQPLVPGVQAWERLGVGVRCETWLGWSTTGWHPVVVKLPRPHQATETRAWASLAREVYVLTRAHHPALPVLYGDRLESEIPHVLLEYVDGPTLADEIDDHGPLDPASLLQLAASLLAALVVVHATGAAHLDVKPDNILVRDGHPVLVDFGSARPLGSVQPPGRPLGTVGYAAPELEACRPITAEMDVYGVGRVLADAAGGRLRVVRAGAPHDPVRDRVERLVAELTQPEPAQRPTVGQALQLLQAAAGAGTLWPRWLLPPD